MNRLRLGRCISGFWNKKRKDMIFVPYSTARQICKMIIMQFGVGLLQTNGCGLSFAKFEHMKLTEIERQKSDLSEGGSYVDQFCLLLPYKPRDRLPFLRYFSIVTHEWLTLTPTADIDETRHCAKFYFHIRLLNLIK